MKAPKKQRTDWYQRLMGVVANVQLSAKVIGYGRNDGDVDIAALETTRNELDSIIAEMKESEGTHDEQRRDH